ncbi:alkaline phosphatase family protein [Novosphingobium sp. PS1R-30]|uniref:phospholipase C n=1 Tax=Novosphingobium anseongense TaxID=3133436 RepID=A0ABU8S112_9SPHN
MNPTSGNVTRRRLLRRTAQALAFSAGATLMPPNLQRALAQAPRRAGSIKDIKHVVMLMLENRSFDHYFGTLPGVRGFGDPKALTLSTGRNVFHQPDPLNPDGYMLPFHLDTADHAEFIPSTSHAWATQHAAWNGGRMDNWLPAHRAADGDHGPYTMGYFKREDIPFHHALADAFTICDGYHCSVMSSTRPNRLYYLSGTIDPEGLAGGPHTTQKTPPEGLRWKTYAERLEEAGVSWKVYQHADDGTGFNLLRLFSRFMDSGPQSPLRLKGMPAASDGEFEWDVMHDRLPTVTWLCPTHEASEHPHESIPSAGAEFIAAKLDALAANPDVWAKTAFILNYDENDGLFDHVPPPVAPDGTPHEFVDGVPIGAGFRVPCIIVSPWTRGGWVCSQPFDHTSILQFLERVTGVQEPNISPWRRRTFGDLTAAFRFGEAPARAPQLPSTAGLFHRGRHAKQHLAVPPLPNGAQQAPTQASGRRRRID